MSLRWWVRVLRGVLEFAGYFRVRGSVLGVVEVCEGMGYIVRYICY